MSSFCRAVYHRGDVTLVDDALSAVDAHVASHLFEKALVGELMKSQRSGLTRSVVLVTNALQFLSDPRVNRIVVLQDGRIIEEGTYSNLVKKDSSVFSRMMSVLENTNVSESDEADESDITIIQGDSDLRLTEVVKKESKQSSKSLMTEEIREKGQVDINVYLGWADAAGGTIVPISIIVSHIVYEVVSVLSNWWLTHWSANGASGKSQYYFLTIYGIINVSAALSDIVRTFILTYFGLRASRKVNNRPLFSFCLDLPIIFSLLLLCRFLSFSPKC